MGSKYWWQFWWTKIPIHKIPDNIVTQSRSINPVGKKLQEFTAFGSIVFEINTNPAFPYLFIPDQKSSANELKMGGNLTIMSPDNWSAQYYF